MGALANYRAGAYSITFDGQAMGQTEVGFEMVLRPSCNIVRADEYGRTPLDGIWTGLEDMVVRAEGIEWTTALWLKAAAWIHSGAVNGKVMKAGTLMSSIAKTLVLAPLTVAGQQQYTCLAFPLEPIRQVFSAQRLRTVPMGFFCFAQSILAQEATVYSIVGA